MSLIRGDFGGVRYGHIDTEHEDAIIDKYLTEFYGDTFHRKLFFDLDEAELSLLAGYILTDRAFHLPSYEMRDLYRQAGGTVYHYLIDVQTDYDYFLNETAPYEGCGHQMELYYLFGRPKTRIDSGQR